MARALPRNADWPIVRAGFFKNSDSVSENPVLILISDKPRRKPLFLHDAGIRFLAHRCSLHSRLKSIRQFIHFFAYRLPTQILGDLAVCIGRLRMPARLHFIAVGAALSRLAVLHRRLVAEFRRVYMAFKVQFRRIFGLKSRHGVSPLKPINRSRRHRFSGRDYLLPSRPALLTFVKCKNPSAPITTIKRNALSRILNISDAIQKVSVLRRSVCFAFDESQYAKRES